MTQMLRAARFDIKETTFLKVKNKAREVNIAQIQTVINEMCDVFIDQKNVTLFKLKKKKLFVIKNRNELKIFYEINLMAFSTPISDFLMIFVKFLSSTLSNTNFLNSSL